MRYRKMREDNTCEYEVLLKWLLKNVFLEYLVTNKIVFILFNYILFILINQQFVIHSRYRYYNKNMGGVYIQHRYTIIY